MNEKKIWDKLISSGMTKSGAAGLMGNLYAESALNPKNLQQTYEKSLGYSDDSYTAAVDSGRYTNFVRDSAGYGLCQWTFWTRKQALLAFAKERNCSVGDLDMQLDFLIKELKSGYSAVWKVLCSASDVKNASDAVMCQYECPADVSTSARTKRAGFGQKYFNMFADSAAEANKTAEELAQEVLENKWGTGLERRERLTVAGYDYQAVQKAVNALLNSSGNSAEIPKTESKQTIAATVNMDGKTYSGTLTEE